MLVWDDEIEVEEGELLDGPDSFLISSPIARSRDLPSRPRGKRRSHSIGPTDFPPPMKRASTDMTGLPRPVSFASKFPRINPGASGVTILEHMERLDAVEASLQRLGDELLIEEVDEDDQGDIGASPALRPPPPTIQENEPYTSISTTKQDHLERELAEVDESDITYQGYEHMAASMPHIGSRSFTVHGRMGGDPQSPNSTSVQQHLDWMQGDKKKIVVVEVSILTRINCFNFKRRFQRLEIVKEKSFFSCW
jgi:phosphatidylinositol 4-kinase type 2